MESPGGLPLSASLTDALAVVVVAAAATPSRKFYGNAADTAGAAAAAQKDRSIRRSKGHIDACTCFLIVSPLQK